MTDLAEETLPQTLRALRSATRTRLAQADLLDQIEQGTTTVVAVLTDRPQIARGMEVIDLLKAQRHWGLVRSRKLLSKVKISEHWTLRRLTERQRVALIVELRNYRQLNTAPQATVANSPEVHAQRLGALARGNWVRTSRAQLKRDLRAGRADLRDLVSNVPDYCGTARVIDLLLAVPGYGPVKSNQLLSSCKISGKATCGKLTDRQRAELLARIRVKAT